MIVGWNDLDDELPHYGLMGVGVGLIVMMAMSTINSPLLKHPPPTMGAKTVGLGSSASPANILESLQAPLFSPYYGGGVG